MCVTCNNTAFKQHCNTHIKTKQLYIYIYIYREREREKDKYNTKTI